MASAIKLNNVLGGSLTLKVDDTITTDDEVVIDGDFGKSLFSADWDGEALSGADLTAVNIIGTNPYAKLYPDGSICGGSDNGKFVVWGNGEARVNVELSLNTNDVRYTATSPIVFISDPVVSWTCGGTINAALARVTCDSTTTTMSAGREGGTSGVYLLAGFGRWKA